WLEEAGEVGIPQEELPELWVQTRLSGGAGNERSGHCRLHTTRPCWFVVDYSNPSSDDLLLGKGSHTKHAKSFEVDGVRGASLFASSDVAVQLVDRVGIGARWAWVRTVSVDQFVSQA
ncbi:unnamed protein product, partial [Ectocarpus fasciculatus]